MEPTTTALTLVGGKLAYDVLGPAAKYLGGELKGVAEVGVENVKRVFEYAKKRNLELEKSEGSVSPRLLYPMLQSAYFCEDELVASYLGGVLSSSRSSVERDDRAIRMVKMIDGLSSYALRLHCIVYASAIKYPKKAPQQMYKWLNAGFGVTVLFDEEKIREKMAFVDSEQPEEILEHSFLSLSAHGLSMEGYRYFRLRGEDRTGRFCRLSLRGVELFCWGNGHSQGGSGTYFSGQVTNEDTDRLAIEPIATELGMASW